MESYLRARYETWKFSRDGLQAAERHLKNGMEIVGDNALLFASLGHAYANYAQLGIDRSRLAEVVGLGVDHAVVTTEAGGKRPFVTYGTVEDGDPATCDRAFEGDTMRASHRRWIGTHQ
jgi:hypothetical protein